MSVCETMPKKSAINVVVEGTLQQMFDKLRSVKHLEVHFWPTGEVIRTSYARGAVEMTASMLVDVLPLSSDQIVQAILPQVSAWYRETKETSRRPSSRRFAAAAAKKLAELAQES